MYEYEKIVDYGLDKIHIMSRRGLVKKTNKKYFKMLKDNGIEIKTLSKEQKKQVDDIYKKYGFKYTYKTHQLAYSVTGKFRADIVPEDMFRTEIEIYLNDYDSKYVLTDKSYFDIFMPNVKFPHTIVRNIEGNFYDHEYNRITAKEAKELVDSYDKIVYKPSVDSGFGRGVALVDTKEENPLEFSKKNYVIQEVIKQHPELSVLNESSVNVVSFIAWDFCVNADGEVICMEYNARGPGVLYYQYCNGGLLGEHADKVFDYVKKEKAKRKLL